MIVIEIETDLGDFIVADPLEEYETAYGNVEDALAAARNIQKKAEADGQRAIILFNGAPISDDDVRR